MGWLVKCGYTGSECVTYGILCTLYTTAKQRRWRAFAQTGFLYFVRALALGKRDICTHIPLDRARREPRRCASARIRRLFDREQEPPERMHAYAFASFVAFVAFCVDIAERLMYGADPYESISYILDLNFLCKQHMLLHAQGFVSSTTTTTTERVKFSTRPSGIINYAPPRELGMHVLLMRDDDDDFAYIFLSSHLRVASERKHKRGARAPCCCLNACTNKRSRVARRALEHARNTNTTLPASTDRMLVCSAARQQKQPASQPASLLTHRIPETNNKQSFPSTIVLILPNIFAPRV